jgi:hypothetical protein
MTGKHMSGIQTILQMIKGKQDSKQDQIEYQYVLNLNTVTLFCN